MKHFFSYSYRSQIDINAPKEEVWKVLADFSSYKNWNPFTMQIDTNLKLGSKVLLTVQMKPGKKPIIQTEYLKAFEPKEKMIWGFNYSPALKAQRTQKLIAVNDKTTRYENEDSISGLLSPIVHIFYGKWIQRGFDSLCRALKNHTEND